MFGNTDCGQWTAKPSATQKEWVLGMLTGMNYQHQMDGLWPVDPLNNLNSAYQAFLWVDNYCKAHPLNGVNNAVVDLFNELWKKGVRTDSTTQ